METTDVLCDFCKWVGPSTDLIEEKTASDGEFTKLVCPSCYTMNHVAIIWYPEINKLKRMKGILSDDKKEITKN